MKTRQIMVEAGILAAMVNDDYSGLSASDITAIERWQRQNPGWQITAPDSEAEPSFARCEITRLAGDCVATTAYCHAAASK